MEDIAKRIQRVVYDLYAISIKDMSLSRPDSRFGDIACNDALQLAREVHKNPRDIAEEIAQKLREYDDFTEVSVAGPGFINIRLADQAIRRMVISTPRSARTGEPVVIETNNPNPFKAMHIGHAFNSIIADTIANLLENDGALVHRVSYHGDVGTHVGKSMYSLLRYCGGAPEKLDEIPAQERNSFMSRMYAEGSRAYNEDAAAKEEIARLSQQSFTLDDPIFAKIYTTCKQWSFDEIDKVMRRIGNQPIERRYLESEADAKGVPIVCSHVPDVFMKSDGALVFPGSRYGSFDNVFVNSRGQGLYGARDLGLMLLKNEDFHPKKSYIVTAEEQRDYFKGVIKAAELCMPELAGVTVNIPTGTVKLTTGKMSSRNGEVVEIAWLFDQMADAIRTRGAEPTEMIIAGAMRYQFLRVKIGSDVVFDVHDSVSITGNSGPYLQYAHARARSILRKATTIARDDQAALDESERHLALKMTEYSDCIAEASKLLQPHIVCTYLYELAQAFNRFYEKSRIIGDDRQDIRLVLVEQYANILQQGLQALGIEAPEQL